MPTEKKVQVVEELEDVLSRASIGVLTDYRGLKMPDITALRRKLQAAGGDYRVVKNTMARIAAARVDREELAESFTGPVALAVGYDEITQIARIITDYIRETRLDIGIKGGFTSDRVLSAADITTLSTIPSKEVLLARLMGQLNGPVTSLVSVLSGPIRGLAQVLQAQINKMEEA